MIMRYFITPLFAFRARFFTSLFCSSKFSKVTERNKYLFLRELKVELCETPLHFKMPVSGWQCVHKNFCLSEFSFCNVLSQKL